MTELNIFLDFVIMPFGVLFLWNLACAPYRIVREREEKIKIKNTQLKALLKIELEKRDSRGHK